MTDGSPAVDDDRARKALEPLHDLPAFVRDRHLTVIASNALARALSPAFAEGVNLARFAFLETADQPDDSCRDAGEQIAAMLRTSLDLHRQDESFRRLVGELSARSARFSVAWATEVASARTGRVTFGETAAGPLTLTYREHWLDPDGSRTLVVFDSDESQTAVRLAELAALVDGDASAG